MAVRSFVAMKDLGLELLVVLGVALAFTVVTSVFAQFHQVAAEDLNVNEVKAMVPAAGTQVLNIRPWGVALTLPLGAGMPLMTYASEGPDSVGLSSVDLEKYGQNCSAGQNAAGAIIRTSPDNVARFQTVRQKGMVLAQIGGYDYVYLLPQNPCMSMQPAANVAAQEAISVEGTGSIGPLDQ